MKIKSILITIIILIVFVSCKEKTETIEVETIENSFKVEFIFKSNKEDLFKIMLNNIVVNDFQKKNIHFHENIIKTTNEDKVSVNFGNDKSYNLLINFGNKNEKIVDITNILLIYNDKEVIVTPSNISDYFIFNKFISINDKGQLVTKTVDGAHNPIIVLKRKAFNELFPSI